MGDDKTDHWTTQGAIPGAIQGTIQGTIQETAKGTILVVAGLDPSGGAGLLADARQIERHGLRCAGVATALTEQDSRMCAVVHPISAEVIANQLARLLDDLDGNIAAVKIGMLANSEIAAVVAKALSGVCRGRGGSDGVPMVVDPVLRATEGVALLDATTAAHGSAQSAYAPLFGLMHLITPNLAELAELSGIAVHNTDEMIEAAKRLRALGPRAVLAKGGHLDGDPVDILVDEHGTRRFGGRRIEGPSPHGTGCALSTDIACRLAKSVPLDEAVGAATTSIRTLIANARPVGKGRPLL